MNLQTYLINNIEFFSDLANHNICYALLDDTPYRVKDLPRLVRVLIWADIFDHPLKRRQLTILGFTGNDETLEKYCSCCFGKFDRHPDFSHGHFHHAEFVGCPVRKNCPANGILCKRLTVGNNQELTDRQLQVLELVGRRLLNKEIADQLDISEETVKIHIKTTQKKAGLMNKKDLVWLAHENNLTS